LHHIHSHGLVHNDIKPSNVFLVIDSCFGALCKIGDFGMTRERGSSDDGEEGDQKYMASEVLASGKKEASADMFSLGLSIYELAANLTFELPADGPRWHDLRKGQHVLDVPGSRSTELITNI
jgi:serine/threonine protein kinase